MRPSKALVMRRTSESLREEAESENDASASVSPVRSQATNEAVERLIPGRLRDLGASDSCVTFAAWGEREWALKTYGNRVHLDAVDFISKQFLTYQWIEGEQESDIPRCCVFAPPLIPLKPPSSLHECRSLESIGTFAIAWERSNSDGPSEFYVRIYDPEDAPVAGLCQDRRWVHHDQMSCSIGQVQSLAFAPGGSHCIAGGAEGLQLWNLQMKDEIWAVRGPENCPGGVAKVQFSPEGRLLASVAPKSRMMRLWWRSESAGHGGFAFILLPHGDPVRDFAWRPRSSSSIYGTAQSLLTQCESGVVRVWQESDPLEDFDFYIVCEITTCRPSTFVSWINYYADYDGLLWPPPSSLRKRHPMTASAQDEEIKRNKVYSSKRVWGALDRGHGHAWFGEAAYDNLESRLGSFPSSSHTRDWIVSVEQDKVVVWSVEGLGEHARTAIRCEIWVERELHLPGEIRHGLVFRRFLVPVCYEGRTIPRCDELYADNVPSKLQLCAQSADGSMGLVTIEFGDSTAEWSTERRSQDEKFEFDYQFNQGHSSAKFTLVCHHGEMVTQDANAKVVWWDGDGSRVLRVIDGFMNKVLSGCFASLNGTRRLILMEEESEILSLHDLSESNRIVSSGKTADENGMVMGMVHASEMLFIIRDTQVVQFNQQTNERKVVRTFHSKVSATCQATHVPQAIWVAYEDASVALLNVADLGSSGDIDPQQSKQEWKVSKMASAGTWVARLVLSPKLSQPTLLMSSIASNLSAGLEEEEEAILKMKVIGLDESRSIVDFSLCELGSTSLICGLAILLDDGSVKIATKKGNAWTVAASSASLHRATRPSQVTWLDKGKLLVFYGDKGEGALEFSGWTSNVSLPWTFAGGLAGPEWMIEDKTFKRSKRKGNDDDGPNESSGHVTWLCASSQLSLPAHHPMSLQEDLRHGRLNRVGRVLEFVSKTLSLHVKGRSIQIPWLDDKDDSKQSDTLFVRTRPSTNSSSSGDDNRKIKVQETSLLPTTMDVQPATAAALFATPVTVTLFPPKREEEEEEEPAADGGDWLTRLESKLPTVRIAGLSPSDHLSLLSCVSLYRRLKDENVSGMDPPAIRFALGVEALKVQTRGQFTTDSLRTCEAIWAMHSDSQAVLMKTFLDTSVTWPECRSLGAAFWVQSPDDLKQLCERLAKSHFIKFNKDPFRSLLFYVALNKPRVASALFKAGKNDKVATLLAQDFTQERWQVAAAKNAYALVERKRYEEAAGFFLLGNKQSEALRVLARTGEDFQLALFVGKVVSAVTSQSSLLVEFIKDIYMEVAVAAGDPWLTSMLFTLTNDHTSAIRCFSANFFRSLAKQEESTLTTSGAREKRKDRQKWLRQVAGRIMPKCGGFDPVVLSLLEHLVARPPFLFRATVVTELDEEKTKLKLEFSQLIEKNRERAILFYLSQGLPRLAQDLMKMSSSTDDVLLLKCKVSEMLPTLITLSSPFSSSDHALMKALNVCCREMNLLRCLLRLGNDHDDTIRTICDHKIALAFQSLAFGGVSSARVSARRLACYGLLLSDQIGQGEDDLASIASYSAVVLSAALLKQYALLDAFFSAGPFEKGKPLRTVMISAALRLSKEFSDYEETSLVSKSDPTVEWAPQLARGLLNLFCMEELVQQLSRQDTYLVRSIGALITRMRSDLHHLAHLPDGSNGGFSSMVDPLRPFLATSKSFEDFNEQALWTRFSGPERILKLVGELAHSVRFRNKRPFLPTHGAAAMLPLMETKRGPLTSIVLYQTQGEYLSGLVLSQALPNYVVVGSVERGTRDVNIKSSLRYRNRTPDGRGLIDNEKETWNDVYRRFAEQERSDGSDDGWELFLSASATGMRQRYTQQTTPVASPAQVIRKVRQVEPVQRAGSFLPFSHQRTRLALKAYVTKQRPVAASSRGPSRDDPISRIASHPFLPIFASGANDGAAYLWHIGESQAVCKLSRPNGYSNRQCPITRLRVSPDGHKVVAADAMGRCSLWQVDLGESSPFMIVNCTSNNRPLTDVAFLNLSSVFATCSSEGIVSLWDSLLPARSSCVASWYKPMPPVTGIPGAVPQLGLCSLVFSPQTRCLITGTERGSIYSIDVRQCKTAVEAKQIHQKSVVSLAISPDGYTLGSGSTDGSLKLFTLDDLALSATVSNLHPYSFTHHQAVTEIAFAPNGAVFSCGADGAVKITYSSEAVM